MNQVPRLLGMIGGALGVAGLIAYSVAPDQLWLVTLCEGIALICFVAFFVAHGERLKAFSARRSTRLGVHSVLMVLLFAEERKLRTFELLMTSPIRLNDVVIGKFLGAWLIFFGMLALTGIVPVILSVYSSFDWRPVLTGYLGLALMGALFLATGLFASALTENQIVAAFLSFGLLILVWLLGALGSVLGDNPIGNTISYLSFIEHYDRLVRGLVDTKDLIYYLSGMVLMLFLAHRVVESQRWK